MDDKYIEKPWGAERIWARTDKYVGKFLYINAGEQLSLQYHEEKDETIIVSVGRIKLEYYLPDDLVPTFRILTVGEAFHIPPGMKHRMIALDNSEVTEVSTPQLNDVIRLEDRYGRA